MHLAFALPTPAETGGGGGADYIDGLAGGLRSIGISVDLLFGDDPVFPVGSIPVVDGMLLPRVHHRLEELVQADAVALIHHIAAGAGRDQPSRTRTLAVERSMLARMRRLIATSVPVADRLKADFSVLAHPIPPGVRESMRATPDPETTNILSVGVLTRRKGHDRLIQVAARLIDLPWRLVIAGDSQREPAHVGELRALADDLGIGVRVTILADCTQARLESEWRRASICVLATRWEGYPSVIAEALQRGIPCLTTLGANAEAILPPGAGVICPLDDWATFGKCLRRLTYDAGLRSEMASAARSAGQTLPRWADRAREFIAFLEK